MPLPECHANDRKHRSIAPHVRGVAASRIRQHRGAAQAQVPEDVTMRGSRSGSGSGRRVILTICYPVDRVVRVCARHVGGLASLVVALRNPCVIKKGAAA